MGASWGTVHDAESVIDVQFQRSVRRSSSRKARSLLELPNSDMQLISLDALPIGLKELVDLRSGTIMASPK